jgi:hypothetical protein
MIAKPVLCWFFIPLSLLLTFFFSKAPHASDIDLIGSFPDVWVTVWALINFNSYYTDNLFSPNGSTLLLHNLTESIGFISYLLRLNPLTDYRSICLLVFYLNYLTSYWFFGITTKFGFLSSFLALLFIFHPFQQGHLDGGHLNIVANFTIILTTISIVYYIKGKLQLSFKLLLISLIITVYTDWYLLFLEMLLVNIGLVYLLCFKHSRFIDEIKFLNARRTFWIYLLAFIILFSPKIIATLTLLLRGEYTNNHNPLLHSADLIYFILPTNYQISYLFIPNVDFINKLNSAESSLYLGYVPLLIFISTLILPKLRKSAFTKPLMVLIFLGFFLSIGPKVNFIGSEIIKFNPLFFLIKIFVGGITIPVPARGAILAILGIFTLTLIYLQNNRYLSLKVVICLIMFFEFLPSYPINLFFMPDKVLTTIKNNPTPQVLDLGSPEMATFRTIFHKKAIYGGFLARRPKQGILTYRNLKRKVLKCNFLESKLKNILILGEKNNLLVSQSLESCRKLILIEHSKDLTLWRVNDKNFEIYH